MENKKWDAFISHASEDKDSIVRELTTELQKFHLKVWYDEFSLNVGDSLSKSIDEGLIYSNFGIIISPDFLRPCAVNIGPIISKTNGWTKNYTSYLAQHYKRRNTKILTLSI